MDYFNKLRDLLKTERQEDKRLYEQTTETSSVTERRANGLTWYPIAIRGSEISRGDYITVELERTTHQDIPHQLRFGVPAALFSNHDAKQYRAEGVISHIAGNSVKITLQTDELPEWSRDGKLGIDLLFDDNSYDEMANALKSAAALCEKGKGDHLIRILMGEQPARFHETVPGSIIPSLNGSQWRAVDKIMAANELAIVHGPPGTGKTTTLVQAIKKMIERDNKQILVTAPSNTAVDLLSEKLSEEGLTVLRVGNPVRVSERLMGLTLESKMAGHSSMKEIKKMKKQANEFRNMAHKYKRNFGYAEREQRRALFTEAHRIMKAVNTTEQYIIDDIIAKTQVIAATLVGSNHYTVERLRYDTVVIDEAGQALEPACWIPILKAKRLVMAGDPFQLSPTIKSVIAAKIGLGITLLEKCIAQQPQSVVMLEEQYRMHTSIMGYSSRVFYNNKLKAHASVAKQVLFDGDEPLLFIDTAGCGFEEKAEGTSTANPEEAAFVLKHLAQLTIRLNTHYQPAMFPSIAIISPYKQQIAILKEQVVHIPVLQAHANRISVNTIDSFQGQERDIVYISMTRSNAAGEIGFLSDTRRMNVAMTRARKKLVIIGDSATLSQLDFYADFISYAEELNAYKSAWEYMND